jgi:hypothetical protein
MFKKFLSIFSILIIAILAMGGIGAAAAGFFSDDHIIERDARGNFDDLFVSDLAVNYHIGNENYTTEFSLGRDVNIFSFCYMKEKTYSFDVNNSFRVNCYQSITNCLGAEAEGALDTEINILKSDLVVDSVKYQFYCDRSNGWGNHKISKSGWLSLPDTVKIETIFHSSWIEDKTYGLDYVLIKDGVRIIYRFSDVF